MMLAKQIHPCNMYKIMESKTLVINSFQSDLRAIEEWAEKWLVNFNAKKTHLITISPKKASQLMRI